MTLYDWFIHLFFSTLKLLDFCIYEYLQLLSLRTVSHLVLMLTYGKHIRHVLEFVLINVNIFPNPRVFLRPSHSDRVSHRHGTAFHFLAMGPPFPCWFFLFSFPFATIFNLFSHHGIYFFHIFGQVELRGFHTLLFSCFLTIPVPFSLWSSWIYLYNQN